VHLLVSELRRLKKPLFTRQTYRLAFLRHWSNSWLTYQ